MPTKSKSDLRVATTKYDLVAGHNYGAEDLLTLRNNAKTIQTILKKFEKKNPKLTDDDLKKHTEYSNLKAVYNKVVNKWVDIKSTQESTPTFPDKYPTKLELSKFMSRNMEDYIWVGDKSGGANKPGDEGGRYYFVYKAPRLDIKGNIIYKDSILRNSKGELAPVKRDEEGNITNLAQLTDVIAYKKVTKKDGSVIEIQEGLFLDKNDSVILDSNKEPLFHTQDKKGNVSVEEGRKAEITTYRQMLLIKQDTAKGGHIYHDKNIAEFVSGKILNKLIGDTASTITLMSTGPKSSHHSDTQVYIGSIYYDEYTDLVKTMKRSDGTEFDRRKPFHEKFHLGAFRDALAIKGDDGRYVKPKYDTFYAATAASILVKDVDGVHSGNFGLVRRFLGGVWQAILKKIDHGAGLENLEPKIHMHSHMRHLPWFGPTNHIRELPRELKINPDFAKELERQASEDLDESVEEAMNEVKSLYSADAIIEFAKRSGMNVDKYDDVKKYPPGDPKATDIIAEEVGEFIKSRMKLRQESAKQLVNEINLSTCFDKKNKLNEEGRKDLLALMHKDPEYYMRGDFHFRGKKQRINIGPIKIRGLTESKLKKEVNNVVLSNLTALMETAMGGKTIEGSQEKTKPNIKAFEALFANQTLMKEATAAQKKVCLQYYDQMIKQTADEMMKTKSKDKIAEIVVESLLKETSPAIQQQIQHRWALVYNELGKEQREGITAGMRTVLDVVNKEGFLKDQETVNLAKNNINMIHNMQQFYNKLELKSNNIGWPQLGKLEKHLKDLDGKAKALTALSEKYEAAFLHGDFKTTKKLQNEIAKVAAHNQSAEKFCNQWLVIMDASNSYARFQNQNADNARTKFSQINATDKVDATGLATLAVKVKKEILYEALMKKSNGNELEESIIKLAFLSGNDVSYLKNSIIKDANKDELETELKNNIFEKINNYQNNEKIAEQITNVIVAVHDLKSASNQDIASRIELIFKDVAELQKEATSEVAAEQKTTAIEEAKTGVVEAEVANAAMAAMYKTFGTDSVHEEEQVVADKKGVAPAVEDKKGVAPAVEDKKGVAPAVQQQKQIEPDKQPEVTGPSRPRT